MKYDVLNSKEEILLCGKEMNSKESKCKEFSYFMRKRNSYLDLTFRRILMILAPTIFNRINISQHAKVFSERTTGLYSNYRFYHIYKNISRIQPNSVLEFGSGASTIFIAELLRFMQKSSGNICKFISFEQSEKFYNLIQSNFPVELRDYCEIILSPVQYRYYGEYRGLSYKFDSIPKKVDFAYIDGPTRTRGDSNTQKKFKIMSDIIELINHGCDLKFALTDHRFVNYLAYKELIGDRYNVRIKNNYKSIEISKKN